MKDIIERMKEFTGDSLTERSRMIAKKKSSDTLLGALQDAAKEWTAGAVKEVARNLFGLKMAGKAAGVLSSTSELKLNKGGEEMVLDATVTAEAVLKGGGLSGIKFTFALEGEKPKSFELSAMSSLDDVNDDIEKFIKAKGYTK